MKPITDPDLTEFVDFLRDAGRLLLECGCSSNRIEILAQKLGRSWGVEVDVLALPTGMWISARRGTERIVELTRVRNWSVDLDRLSRISDLIEAIELHNVSVHDAYEALKEVADRKPAYNGPLTLVAGSVSSAVLVYFFHGTLLEIALAMPAGAIVQLLGKYVFVGENRRYLGDFLSAAFVAVFALMGQALWPEVDVPRLTVGGLIGLVPGLTIVNAVHEIAQKNLVSGAAKMIEALMITGALGCGVIFVLGLAAIL